MPPKLQAMLRNVALALHIPAAMALLSIPIAALAGEWFAVFAFAVTAVLAGGVGQAVYWLCRVEDVLGTKLAMATVVIVWGVVPVVSALPFLLVGLDGGAVQAFPAARVFADPWAALFEAFSGFTVTGLTMVPHAAGDLPHALQWWRSLTHWIGGVGVIVLMLSFFHPSQDARRLYVSEGRDQTIAADLGETVRTIWWIYLVFTAFSIGLLWLSGMTWWQALNFGMSGIATGGFSVTNDGMAHFGTLPKLAMMLVVALGAISFGVHARIVKEGRVGLVWQDAETRCLLILFAVGAGLLALENWWYAGQPMLLDSAFQWISALGTAGFSTVDVAHWSPTAHLILIVGMTIGAAAGSTGGGFKISRMMRIVGAAYFRIKSVAAHPWRLVDHKQISDEEERQRAVRALEAAATMLAIWAVTMFAGTVLLLHAAGPGARLSQVLFEVSSAFGNVGLSAGITTSALPWYGKAGLILIMWMGRLEAVPVLVAVGLLVRPFIKGVEAVEEQAIKETKAAREAIAGKTKSSKDAKGDDD